MLNTSYCKNLVLFICLIFAAKCDSFDWEKDISPNKRFDLKNKELTKNLDKLLNYNGDENSDFNENNKKFEGLLKSIGYKNGDNFDVDFDPWDGIPTTGGPPSNNDHDNGNHDNHEEKRTDCYEVTEQTEGGAIDIVEYVKISDEEKNMRRLDNSYQVIERKDGWELIYRLNYVALFRHYKKIYPDEKQLYRFLKAQNYLELYKKYTTPCNAADYEWDSFANRFYPKMDSYPRRGP